MEPPRGDPPKLTDMVMCGDHPSITKTELNAKEDRPEGKLPVRDKKDRQPITYAGLSPSTSRTERPARQERSDRALTEQKSRVLSDHALRLMDARRHLVRSADIVSRHEDLNAPANRALVQAALGSFRWPPYLVAVWVVVLVLTHVLHCLVTMLERALPSLKKFCMYFRTWAESSWRGDTKVNHRLIPLALASVTGLLYALYIGLYAVYAVALWAVEPLFNEEREDETKVTDYVTVEETQSKHQSVLPNK